MTDLDPWADSELVWHYTNMAGAVGIHKLGAIRCHEIRLRESEYPIIWFSDRSTWEPTASRMDGLKLPHFRFGARRVKTIRWPDLARDAGMRWVNRKFLEKTGRACGANPAMWCGTLAMYYDAGSLLPQIETDSGWRTIDLEEVARRIDEVVEFRSKPILTSKGQFRATLTEIVPKSTLQASGATSGMFQEVTK